MKEYAQTKQIINFKELSIALGYGTLAGVNMYKIYPIAIKISAELNKIKPSGTLIDKPPELKVLKQKKIDSNILNIEKVITKIIQNNVRN